MAELLTPEQAAAREILRRLTDANMSAHNLQGPVSSRALDLLLGMADGRYRLSRMTDGQTIQCFPRYSSEAQPEPGPWVLPGLLAPVLHEFIRERGGEWFRYERYVAEWRILITWMFGPSVEEVRGFVEPFRTIGVYVMYGRGDPR